MNLLFIDVETTGTNNAKHGVIEMAAELYTDGKLVDSFHHECFDHKGSRSVSLGALKVNNNDLNMLWSKPEESQAVIALVAFLLKHKDVGPIIVCGQNVQFDVGFIKNMLAKYGVEDLEQIVGYKHLDTYSQGLTLVESGILPKETKLNLAGLAKALGIDITKYSLHTAKGDVALTSQVYFTVINKLRQLNERDLNRSKPE